MNREQPSVTAKTQKMNLKGMWVGDFEQLLGELGEKRYKARQLASWIYAKGATDFSEMTELSKDLREKLSRIATINGVQLVRRQVSQKDLSEKFLFKLSDGEKVETVLMWEADRVTACVSTQVGCPLGCTFCATGQMGCKRNLTAGEIVDQIIALRDNRINHVVLMGMGEPFLNYDEVLKAIKIMNNEMGLSFAAKRITVSTAGIPAMIQKLADENLKLKLAISLNAPTDAKRTKLMPINKKHPVKELLAAVKAFVKKTKRGVTFEYVLIRDINDSEKDALALSKLVQGIRCKINLIPYNPVDDLPYDRPSEERILAFRDYLYPRAPAVTLRRSKGEDILAACGQLRV
ncbi:MAG: 23S rRNA (adenine(2503)-C(2))-methyltransferase RlmN [Candidatus Zixiibacteriota bacterium]|nr:MAG: 23S rRNA (adenine(2503)-C(2))-methyltransferase RlmN [candidate division Zixibacteria bacterium]